MINSLKRLFLLFCLIPALLLCSCGKQAEQTAAPTEPEQVDETKQLEDMATEVALAYGYGKFEDVEKYMLYSYDEQIAMLFPDQSAPYHYEDRSFDSKEAVLNSIRTHLIASEEPAFTITVTGTQLELYTDATDASCFGPSSESLLLDPSSIKAEQAGTVTVSMTLADGEESAGEMQVHFLKIDGQWKVYSPSVAGYFMQLYQASTPH